MKKHIGIFFVLLTILSFNSHASVINIDPGSTLLSTSGPFGFGGRGVVFRAEEDFTMSSFGMDLSFSGDLDFSVDVYDANSGSRSTLLSQSGYSNLTDDNSDFFTLAHNHSFISGNLYEVILRFEDPGVMFTHYDFNNPSLNLAPGFSAGSELLVLDGSDYDRAKYSNTWLANFELTTIGVSEPVSMALLGFGLAVIGFSRKKKKTA